MEGKGMPLYSPEDALIMITTLQSVRLDKMAKDIKKLNSRNALYGLITLGLIYACYGLSERVTKLNAKVIALQTEKDISELERGIEETKE